MARWDVQEQLVPDRHHVGTVIPMTRDGRRPLAGQPLRPVVFDREAEPPGEVVVLSRTEARAIADMLRRAAPSLPWRRAVSEAIDRLEERA